MNTQQKKYHGLKSEIQRRAYSSDPESVMGNRLNLPRICLMWLSTSIVFMAYLFVNIVAAAVVGAFTCWVISLTVLGSWMVNGLNLLSVDVSIDNLYKLGATAGFFAGFLKLKVEK